MSEESKAVGDLSHDDLRKLRVASDEIIDLIVKKNPAYGGSWKAHGGYSAFFNLDRKWSRVQTAASRCHFDVFEAMEKHPDTVDALKDLIAYSLLSLCEVCVVNEDQLVLPME